MQLRQALEDALATNPDDLAAHSAYADWLSESSDPADVGRGELIQVQLALERPDADRPALEARQKALLREHGRTWFSAALSNHLRSSSRIDSVRRSVFEGRKWTILDAVE